MRLPSTSTLREQGGLACIWTLDITLSGGWSSQALQNYATSTIAGPLTIYQNCLLTFDRITVK